MRFEPDGPELWAQVRRTVEDFLLGLWRQGHLRGDRPEEAFFVRCDATTMTQNDLDAGRLVAEIGLANRQRPSSWSWRSVSGRPPPRLTAPL